MGAVFLVEHVHTGDRAALKLLHDAAATDPESIERFKREARAPARIQSENVVRVLDADTAPELGGAPFLVMELLHGSDLQKIVARNGPLPPGEVARVLGQIARALDKAHAIGIVHRDLKPENLFLHQREDGTSVVKILDFGISKTMDDAQMTGAGYQLTRTGAVMGTPLYMAIEQALGRRELIGPGVDVWALGLIAIFLLTGEAYWQGKSVPDILGKVLAYAMYAPSSRWPRLPPAIDRWLLRSCARMPEQRFATAGEQVAELAAILRAAEATAIASAATVLPTMPSYPPPASATPPHVTPYVPPHVAPQVTPYPTPPPPTPYPVPPTAMSPYAIGASTNEPIMQTARPMNVGIGTGAKVAIAVSIVSLVLVALMGLGLIFFQIGGDATDTSTPATDTAPTATATATATATTTAAATTTGPIDPLSPSATATATSTATAKATATAPPRPTATHPSITRAQCGKGCLAGCVDANDEHECLVKCLKKCPAK
jgi:serine/threonine protein kinase